mmetsp:Transcript_15079/g.47993  ORF Transcript_15079/g.47993 Transcript_15079/m.47993 type:complete len:210 (-) Transcript_15079:114-743(-)
MPSGVDQQVPHQACLLHAQSHKVVPKVCSAFPLHKLDCVRDTLELVENDGQRPLGVSASAHPAEHEHHLFVQRLRLGILASLERSLERVVGGRLEEPAQSRTVKPNVKRDLEVLELAQLLAVVFIGVPLRKLVQEAVESLQVFLRSHRPVPTPTELLHNSKHLVGVRPAVVHVDHHVYEKCHRPLSVELNKLGHLVVRNPLAETVSLHH